MGFSKSKLKEFEFSYTIWLEFNTSHVKDWYSPGSICTKYSVHVLLYLENHIEFPGEFFQRHSYLSCGPSKSQAAH